MTTKTLEGIVKYNEAGELVAEISQRDAAFLAVGKAVITVAGVTGRVRKLGRVFSGRQYAYLADAEGSIPERVVSARPEIVSQDNGQSEIRNAII